MLSGLNLYSFDLFGWLFRSRKAAEAPLSEFEDDDLGVDDRERHDERFYFFGMFPMM